VLLLNENTPVKRKMFTVISCKCYHHRVLAFMGFAIMAVQIAVALVLITPAECEDDE
jgi:hypothetical protein